MIPELKNIPNKYIHLPGELDDKSLIEYGVKLGSDYPYPIVDLSSLSIKVPQLKKID